jgi:polynucleotide 5'-hydroxyl-kinase GRC3/NOL9
MGSHVASDEVFERLLANPGVVLLVGGIDAGKTTFGIELARRATAANIETAFVDADIGQSVVGPPSTVGLKCSGFGDFSTAALRHADSLSFVGSIAPRGHMLPLVTGTAKLTQRAKDSGARMIIVDTSGFVSGLSGQGLKYYKMDVLAPDFVVGFERGGELEPILGVAQRFTPAEVIELEIGPEVVVRSVEERITFREEQFATYFAEGASRWRVKPTVFMPTLPPEFDLALLDALVVGMENGKGTCVGIGVLEYDAREDILRMVSPVTAGVRGLRLGSIRIDTTGRSRGPVDLKQLFQTE